jgi:signal transduction histidine kinase
VVIGGAFALLLFAINGLSDSEERANHSLEVLVSANRLERMVVDLETGERGYIITGQPRFLQPWQVAREGIPRQAAALERLATQGDHGQGPRASQIAREVNAYITQYSVPLVNMARRDLASARTVEETAEGKRRIDSLRGRFERFTTLEGQVFQAGKQRAENAARQAIVVASVSVAGSIILIMLSGGYLARAVVRPVRRASGMAGRVAGGDLAVRMPETGPGEVGVLERALNTMAGSLGTSRNELRRVADEQAALRRVATLAARGVSPAEVFGAVAAETGLVLGAECTAVARYEPDGTAVVTGSWGRPGTAGLAPRLGERWPGSEGSITSLVLRSGHSARVPSYQDLGGELGSWAREHGVRSSVGSPVIVEGLIWGMIIALWGAPGAPPEGTEERLLDFTELVAVAVASTESRAELADSRARVVAAADQTRRRIERDLHDGTQQRLISLALEMRSTGARMPPGQQQFARQWARIAKSLTDAAEELREFSRGVHPAILEKGGLGPALRALARRSAVPAEVSVRVPGRLPERVEVAVYYVVSEALANAAKYARASVIRVDVGMTDGALRLEVADDGTGGADPSRGSGLIGLSDRVESVGGRLAISSPAGDGTTLTVTIPLAAALALAA